MKGMRSVHIDNVDFDSMVYDGSGMPLGVVREYFQMNGNRSHIPKRHLDNGKPADRFAYRREILYARAKGRNGGIVFIKRAGVLGK